MLALKSLRARFALSLASASAVLIAIFSVLIYHYIKITILENSAQVLRSHASSLASHPAMQNPSKELLDSLAVSFGVEYIELLEPINRTSVALNGSSLILKQPITLSPQKNVAIAISADISHDLELLDQILANIIIATASAVFLVLFYALFLSRMLLLPIKSLANKVSSLNERFLNPLDESQVATEFAPLASGINRLISRLKTFAMSQKELFIGTAHELKTPLAVMKTKAEVTLIKPRDSEAYIAAIRENIEQINKMNKMVSSILEVGRGEGAQLEPPVATDIIAELSNIAENFAMLANKEDKKLDINLTPASLKASIQPQLLNQIIQNFLQNALKFSPAGAVITLSSYVDGGELIVEVADEGAGIDDDADLFAPFKRDKNSSGAGLGLFLARSAAAALGGLVSIKNRGDRAGALATLKLPITPKKG